MSEHRFTCAEIRELLRAAVYRDLDPAESDAAEEHLLLCERCSEAFAGSAVPLFQMLDAELETDQEELRRAILAQTAGMPCERAQELLGRRADEPLNGLDAELLDAHLLNCRDCRSLASALDFGLAVLRGTAATPVPHAVFPRAASIAAAEPQPSMRRERWETWRRKLGQVLIARPRVAYEAAYAATVVLAVIAGPLQFDVQAWRDSALKNQAQARIAAAVEDASEDAVEIHQTLARAASQSEASVSDLLGDRALRLRSELDSGLAALRSAVDHLLVRARGWGAAVRAELSVYLAGLRELFTPHNIHENLNEQGDSHEPTS